TPPRCRRATRRGRGRRRSRSRSAGASRFASDRDQVAEDEPVALDHLAAPAGDRLGEDRPGGHERVELAVLAARIDAARKLGKQLFVVVAPAEAGVEGAWVDADQGRLEPCVEKLACERGRVGSPERKETASAGWARSEGGRAGQE